MSFRKRKKQAQINKNILKYPDFKQKRNEK